jgi:hypothetical protein
VTPQIEQRTTPALRIHPSSWRRFSAGISLLALCGFFGTVLMIIPPVGILVWIAALISPFYYVWKADSCDTLTGSCPHCTREVKVAWTKARKGGFNCKFCKRRLILQGLEGVEHFLAV